jgi:hypothetical protein
VRSQKSQVSSYNIIYKHQSQKQPPHPSQADHPSSQESNRVSKHSKQKWTYDTDCINHSLLPPVPNRKFEGQEFISNGIHLRHRNQIHNIVYLSHIPTPIRKAAESQTTPIFLSNAKNAEKPQITRRTYSP